MPGFYSFLEVVRLKFGDEELPHIKSCMYWCRHIHMRDFLTPTKLRLTAGWQLYIVELADLLIKRCLTPGLEICLPLHIKVKQHGYVPFNSVPMSNRRTV